MKVSAWLLIALAICLGISLWISSSTTITSRTQGTTDVTVPTPEANINSHSTDSPLVTQSSPPNFESSTSRTETDKVGHQDATSPVDSDGPPTKAAEELVDTPWQDDSRFHISESVLANCLKRNSGVCEDQVLDLIDRLIKEERNAAWAREAETRLRLLAPAANRENVVRRCLCGSTICAIEVASKQGRFGGYLDSDPWLNSQLELWDGIYGYENGSDGSQITISLKVYRRR